MDRNRIFSDESDTTASVRPDSAPDYDQWVNDQVTAQPLPKDRPPANVQYQSDRAPDLWVAGDNGLRLPLWYENKAAEDMNKNVLWRFASGLIPKGWGTYCTVTIWMGINIAGMLGFNVPGFESMAGNEGAGLVGGAILAYLRRAIQ